MRSGKIVGTGPVGRGAYDILRDFGEIVIACDHTEEAILPLMGDAIALVVRGEGIANAAVIAAAPGLRVIGRTGTGFDNVDIAAATSRKIPVVYTPGANARAVAEGALAFILSLCKRISYWDTQLKSGNWAERDISKPGDMEGKVLGIVGLGNIGQNLAQLLEPFEMCVVAYDPYVAEDKAKALGVRLVEFDELMRMSDFISLHAPLTKETKGIINRKTLGMVKPGAYLVNLARGGLVESLDVIHEAITNGKLAGAALDVFEPEPPDVGHPLFKLPQCITSPHVQGMTPGAMERILETMAMDMAAVLKGIRPRHVANPEVFS